MRRSVSSPPGLLGAMALDGVAVSSAHFAAYLLRFDGLVPPSYRGGLVESLPLLLCSMLGAMALGGVYRIDRRFAGTEELFLLVRGILLGVLGFVLALFLLCPQAVPRGVVLLDLVLVFLFACGTRLALRLGPSLRLRPSRGAHVLVYGAGSAGAAIVREMRSHRELGKIPAGFVDDEPRKRGVQIHGVRVLGTAGDLPHLVRRHRIDEIVIAAPSATGPQMRRMVEACRAAGTRFRTVPALWEILDGRVRVAGVREVRIEDLLGRAAVRSDVSEVRAFLARKRVLVTGATGSIGSELCRQVLAYGPERLVLLDRNENGMFRLESELAANASEGVLQGVLCDVTDASHVRHVFESTAPDVVFHAAAYKHVPLMERHPVEAVRNNVFGTQNVAEATERFGVGTFVLVSTDKAVAPTSVMGATKRLAGFTLQDRARTSTTRFITVRFGNVLGSDGSVLEIFRRQIAGGGPVTVTSPAMRRYFMTIPEAVQLTMQAATMGRGGEIFILDMGTPVFIDELARQMIRLSGLEPDREVEIRYVGLRPGEKLEEQLWTGIERPARTVHPKILVAQSVPPERRALRDGLERLRFAVARRDPAAVLAGLRELVPDYVPQVADVDAGEAGEDALGQAT